MATGDKIVNVDGLKAVHDRDERAIAVKYRTADTDFDYGELKVGGINKDNAYTSGTNQRRVETYWPVIDDEITIQMSGGLTGYLRLYDSNKTMIDPDASLPGANTTNHYVLIGKNESLTLRMKDYNVNAAYFRFTMSSGTEEIAEALIPENARFIMPKNVATQEDVDELQNKNMPNIWGLFRNAVCIGDSLTRGYLSAYASKERNRDYGYPSALARLTGMNVWNYGLSGSDPGEWVADATMAAQDYSKFDVAFVSFGQNIDKSGGGSYTESEYEELYMSVLQRLKTANSNMVIFCLSNPGPRAVNGWIQDFVATATNQSGTYAYQYVYYLDVSTDAPYTSRRTDGTHLDALGYSMLAECVKIAVEKLYAQNPTAVYIPKTVDNIITKPVNPPCLLEDKVEDIEDSVGTLESDVSDLKSALDLVTDFVGYDEPVDLKGTDWGVGYFNTSTAEFVDCVGLNNNNSKRIVQKAIQHTDKAIVCNIASGYRYIIQFWNSDGTHKATTGWQTGEYTIPAGYYYVAGQVAQLTDSVNITDYTQNGLYDAFSMEYADGSGKGSTTTIPEQFDAVRDDINAIRDEIGVSDKTIVCFGNSLTMGATASYSNPWPTQLEALLPDYTIKNHGISGEGVQTIGARQGGIPMLTDATFTIPADTVPVAITFTNMLGGSPTPLIQLGTSKATPGINPCSIAGVSGNLTLSNGVYYFTRTTAGSAVTVNRPTAIITDSMKNDRADILVLWTGENGQFDDSYDNLIAYEKLIVDYSKNRNYLIIGRSNASYTGSWGTAYNRGMMLAHGRKYINIVEYLSKYGLSDLNITPTADDETAISNGLIPPSLKTDSTHLTTDAYGIVARLVYERGVELGYWI